METWTIGVEWSSERMTRRPFGRVADWYWSFGGRTAACRGMAATAATAQASTAQAGTRRDARAAGLPTMARMTSIMSSLDPPARTPLLAQQPETCTEPLVYAER